MTKETKVTATEEIMRFNMMMSKRVLQQLKTHADKKNKWFEKGLAKKVEKTATATSVILEAVDFYFKQNFYEDGTPVVVSSTHPLPLHIIHKNFYAREGEKA